MNVVYWLEQVGKLDELINAKNAEYDRIMALATSITAKAPDGIPHSNNGTVSDPVGNSAVKLARLSEEINALIDKYVDYKQEVVSALEKLPEKEYGVLHRYYIRYMTFEKIAEDMGFCRQQIWRIKKKALKNLEDVIECNIKR